MSLFTKQYAVLKQALESAGIDPNAITPANAATYLQAWSAAAVEAATAQQAEESAQLQAAAAQAQTALESAQAELQTARDQSTALRGAIAAAGVKAPADATPEQLTQAIQQRADTRAAELLAAKGHPHLLADEPPPDPANPKSAKTLKGKARALAHWAAQRDPAA